MVDFSLESGSRATRKFSGRAGNAKGLRRALEKDKKIREKNKEYRIKNLIRWGKKI